MWGKERKALLIWVIRRIIGLALAVMGRWVNADDKSDHTNTSTVRDSSQSNAAWHDCNITDWGKQSLCQGSQWSWYWTKMCIGFDFILVFAFGSSHKIKNTKSIILNATVELRHHSIIMCMKNEHSVLD